MSDRIAVVTGASKGIGKATALALCQSGYRVVFASRTAESSDELKQAMEPYPGSLAVNIDLASQESIEAAFAQILKDLGRIDVLVNNAGVTKDGLAMRMKRSDWDSVLQTNLTGAFLCIQQVMMSMVKQRFGRIINVASVVAETGNAGQANYVASKAGLIGLTKTIAQELASRGITVNAITPGFIETDMTAVLPDALKEKMLSNIPLKRFGKPEDIAAAVKFLASDEAGYITGAVLKVNGGLSM